ncbi:single-stranded DNA-binding protein [Patescibacteria group bacterium]
MDLNKVTIIGRLTRDPEVKTTPSGQTVASFSLATSFTWKDASGVQQKKTEFHNIVAWRKLAEICGQYLVKGKQIYLEGRLETRDWTGQDGIKRYRTEIIADNMIMLGSPQQGQQNYSAGQAPTTAQPATQPQTPQAPVAQNQNKEQQSEQVGEEEIRVEDIPF